MTDVMVVDDELGMRAALEASFRTHGWRVQTASGKNDAVRTFQAAPCPLVVTDMRMPDGDGFGVMQAIRAISPKTAFIFLTAFGTVQEAVSAMQEGACDFMIKPVSFDRLQETAKRILNRQPQPAASAGAAVAEGLIGRSPRFRALLDRIRHIASTDADILIEAESGTGKEKLARFIHQSSHRRNAPFVAVNCAAFPETLLESELFGHVKGAFTDAKVDRVGRFELADGGTLFLDEIANVPMNLQAKLLRALETGEIERVGSSSTRRVDVRILSATNANVQNEVEAGRFREDLLFRLNTIEIHLPPLRERKEDIPLLAMHFLRQSAQRYRKNLSGFESTAMKLLLEHPWPGNVRELDHSVERAVLMAEGSEVRASDLGLRQVREGSSRIEDMSLEDVERALIQKAMGRYGGNVSHASKTLGLSRSALYRRLQKYGL